MNSRKILRKLSITAAIAAVTFTLGGVKALSAYADDVPTPVPYDVNEDNQIDEGEVAYPLDSVDDLYWFADKVNSNYENYGSANAYLVNDITVNANLLTDLITVDSQDGSAKINDESNKPREWTPIGNADFYYEGTFDGAGYKISGLYFNDSEQRTIGLFGYMYGTIKNVTVADNYFCGADNVGGVCGYNGGTIENCLNDGNVSGMGFNIGGVCGCNGGTIKNSYNEGDVSGMKDCVGGVCGDNGGTIENCFNDGNVSGMGFNIGGVCGDNGGTIENCLNDGNVSGMGSNIGGVCGHNTLRATINSSYNEGDVSGTKDYVGGVCGWNEGTIKNCYNKGHATAKGYKKSGVCGWNEGTIENCYYLEIAGVWGVYDDQGSADTKEMDAADFESGKVCWLLNGGENQDEIPAFYQNLSEEFGDVDAFPVNSNTHHAVKYDTQNEKYYNAHNFYADGFCTVCGCYEEAESCTDVSDIDGDENKEETVYKISNAGQLYWFAGLVNGTIEGVERDLSANAYLANDITINDHLFDKLAIDDDGKATVKEGNTVIPWVNISGEWANKYNGTFDGASHKISGLYCSSNNSAALFEYNAGSVKNVFITDSYIYGGEYTGAICSNNYGTIDNCHSDIDVIGSDYVGGICGNSYQGTIKNCTYKGNVAGLNYVAGICGDNYEGTVENCSCIGDVTGYADYYAGGICGFTSKGSVINCDCTGDVAGSNYVGGICGFTSNESTIENCFNEGKISGAKFVGGVSGSNDQTKISYCHNKGDVSGNDSYAGGFCGYCSESQFEYCYNEGNVESSSYVGGFCGYCKNAQFNNCYTYGNFTGLDDFGGFVGYYNSGTINNCYYLEHASIKGIGNDEEVTVTAKTEEAFESGEVCWLLNGGENQTEIPVWYQNLQDAKDSYPVLDSNHGKVSVSRNCIDEPVYSNSSLKNGEHSIALIAQVDATYTTYGCKAYWHCGNCGKDFSDEKGTKEILEIKSWKLGEGRIEKKAEPTADPTPVVTPIPKNVYVIKFNGNGATSGKISDKTCKLTTKVTLTKNAFKRKGYVFTGWNTKKNGKGKSYDNKAKVSKLAKGGKSITLYAQWKPIKYNVKFNANGGKGTMSQIKNVSYNKTKNLTKNKFTKKGYKFAGWATSKANAKKGKVAYKNKAKVMNLASANGKTVTLYAVWKKK